MNQERISVSFAGNKPAKEKTVAVHLQEMRESAKHLSELHARQKELNAEKNRITREFKSLRESLTAVSKSNEVHLGGSTVHQVHQVLQELIDAGLGESLIQLRYIAYPKYRSEEPSVPSPVTRRTLVRSMHLDLSNSASGLTVTLSNNSVVQKVEDEDVDEDDDEELDGDGDMGEGKELVERSLPCTFTKVRAAFTPKGYELSDSDEN